MRIFRILILLFRDNVEKRFSRHIQYSSMIIFQHQVGLGRRSFEIKAGVCGESIYIFIVYVFSKSFEIIV